MKYYIFITTEGFTFSPVSDNSEPDIDNCQVLGFAEGINEEEAYIKFKEENTYVEKLGFKDIICYQLSSKNPSKYF